MELDQSVLNINEKYFVRPKKEEKLKYMAKLELKQIVPKVEFYSNAVILPLRRLPGDDLLFGRGGVVDEKGDYVELSSIPYRMKGKYEFDRVDYQDKKVVYCGYLLFHWGHFLTDFVSRLWYYLSNDSDDIDNYVFFLNDGEATVNCSGNFLQFFKLLGVDKKLLFICKPTKFKEVIIPQMSYVSLEYYSPAFLSIFDKIRDNVIVEDTFKQYDKIFLTRSGLNNISQNEFGLDKIDEFFVKNGYQLIYAEKTSLSYLIYLFNTSKEIAMVSGTLPHNMLFAKEGTNITIIERQVLINPNQIDFNKIKKLNFTYVDANYGIYPVYTGIGPYFLATNEYLKAFADSKQMDTSFFVEPNYKKAFKKYIKQYFNKNHYKWLPLALTFGDSDLEMLNEAYCEAYKHFGEYIDGTIPITKSEIFKKWILKLKIKIYRLLKKH